MTAFPRLVARVRSFNGGGDYQITETAAGAYECTCPHFRYRLQGTGMQCKHIKDFLGQILVSDKVTHATRLAVPLPPLPDELLKDADATRRMWEVC
jgi:hypothetical protein